MTTLLIFALILLSSNCKQTNEWNGIRLLKTTRAQVEMRLDSPTPGSLAPAAAMYETKDGRVFIRYSIGKCGTAENSGWNVPDSTVIEVRFHPKVSPRLSDFVGDVSKYEKTNDSDILHLVYYRSEEKGIVLQVDTENDNIETITYLPKSADAHMKCRKV